jgi:putative PIN family toxin of toxin-antitoxin system
MPAGERVVVDTNTIISGILLPRSVPGRLLDLLIGAATLIFSPATRDELLGVVAREKFDRYVPAAARERAATILVRDGEMVTPRRFVHVCRDPKDDKFIDAALAGKADCLISGDGDLIDLREFEGIPVLTARSYLAGVVR